MSSTSLPITQQINTKITSEQSQVSPVTISKDAVKSLLKYIEQIIKNPLHDQGIYYKYS